MNSAGSATCAHTGASKLATIATTDSSIMAREREERASEKMKALRGRSFREGPNGQKKTDTLAKAPWITCRKI